ncbi:transposase-like protein [Nonomuraea jabiensis]|uniref:Transposase-like protein n=1 Tax=Nonomuraea jabiensis TaxID=882448 RepID=A0A7W9LIP0_9ACTN|nr:transposase-like protein [Nonomuraea jabiensis]
MAGSGPKAVQIVLSDGERDQLTQLAASSSKLAWRARLVLACAEPGSTNAGVAATMGATPDTVRKWRSRFAASRLAGLADEARPGRPKAALTLSDDERATLTRWVRRASSAQALAQRSKIVPACADGASNADVAARLGVGAHMWPNGGSASSRPGWKD